MGKSYGKGFSLFLYLSFLPFLGYAFLLAKQPTSSFSGSSFSPCTTLFSTDGEQAGKDSVKLASAEGKRRDRAIEARGGAWLPAPGHSLWSTAPYLCQDRKKQGQKLQLMSGMAPPFLSTSASSPESRAGQTQVWRQSGD